MHFKSISKSSIRNLIIIGELEIIPVCEFLRKINNDSKSKENLGEKCLMYANNGNADAQYALSKIYGWGLMCEMDKVKSLHWCQKAFKQEYIPAYFEMAGFYDSGWGGIKIDNNKSYELTEKAALNNFIPAINMLGFYFSDGYLVNKDIKKGICYYQKSADLGNGLAMYSLFLIFKSNDYNNEKESIKWLKKAVKNGCPDAHASIAYFYKSGSYGLKKDISLFKYHLEMKSKLIDGMVTSCII